jgi:hypothetical protein
MAAAHRLFALLLVASTAEVLVFLGALGNAVQLAVGGAARWRGGLVALVVWAGVSLVFLAGRSLVAAIAFNNVTAVVGFARNRIELPGTAVVGWLEATLALVVFAIVFSGVRRRKLRTA